MSEEEEGIFDLMRILGNDTRRRILEMISERPRYLTDLSKELDKGQQAILRHLEDLASCGFLEEFYEKRTGQVGRSKKFYKITQSKRILIDIAPNIFEIHDLPAIPDEKIHEIKIEDADDTLYDEKISELRNRIDSLKEIGTKRARYDELLKIEEELNNEVMYLRDAKNQAERLLLHLNDLKKEIL